MLFRSHGILGSSIVKAAEGSNVRDIATSVNAVFDSTGVSAIASSQLKIFRPAVEVLERYSGMVFLLWSRTALLSRAYQRIRISVSGRFRLLGGRQCIPVDGFKA